MPHDAERIEALRREVAANPASRQFYQLGELLRREGQLDDAIMVLRQGLASHGRYVAAWVSLGRALLEAGRHGQASDALREAISSDPGNPVAWRLLGEARLGTDHKEGALSAFERALDLAPGDETLQGHVERLREDLRDSLFDAGASAPVMVLRDQPEPPASVWMAPPSPATAPPPAPGPLESETAASAASAEPDSMAPEATQHDAQAPDAPPLRDALDDTSPFGRPGPLLDADGLADRESGGAPATEPAAVTDVEPAVLVQVEAAAAPTTETGADAALEALPVSAPDPFADPFDLAGAAAAEGDAVADVFAAAEPEAEAAFAAPTSPEAAPESATGESWGVEPESAAAAAFESEAEMRSAADQAFAEPEAPFEAAPAELEAAPAEPEAEAGAWTEAGGVETPAAPAELEPAAADEAGTEEAWSSADTARIPITAPVEADLETDAGVEALPGEGFEPEPGVEPAAASWEEAESAAEPAPGADDGADVTDEAFVGQAGAEALIRAAEAGAEPAPLPFAGPATVTMARLYIQQQQLDGAVAILERVLDREPVNQEARDLLDLVRDMMEPLPDTLPPISLKERKVAALQRWLASLTLGAGRAER